MKHGRAAACNEVVKIAKKEPVGMARVAIDDWNWFGWSAIPKSYGHTQVPGVETMTSTADLDTRPRGMVPLHVYNHNASTVEAYS